MGQEYELALRLLDMTIATDITVTQIRRNYFEIRGNLPSIQIDSTEYANPERLKQIYNDLIQSAIQIAKGEVFPHPTHGSLGKQESSAMKITTTKNYYTNAELEAFDKGLENENIDTGMKDVDPRAPITENID